MGVVDGVVGDAEAAGGPGTDEDAAIVALDVTDRPRSHAVLAAVYQDKGPVLRRMAQGMVRDPALADDLVQDAFARTLRARRAPDEPDELFFYLVRVVVNLTRSHAARSARRAARARDHRDHRGDEAQAPAERRTDDELAAAVAGLPRRQREVVFLRYWLDLSVDQTAAAMGISAGAVKTHASRAVDRLRTQIDPEGEQRDG